jgi:hypothetical protein
VTCPLVGGSHGGGGQYPRPEGGAGVMELCPRWLAGGGGGQYPPEASGCQYPPGGSSGGHVGGYPAIGDPLHSITGGGVM